MPSPQSAAQRECRIQITVGQYCHDSLIAITSSITAFIAKKAQSCTSAGRILATITMPQIEFHPPLATTTTLHLPPLPVLPGDPHVLLTFYAKPIDALYEGDRIEIWTDGGSPGQWRSVPFTPTQDGKHVATISVRVEDGSFGYTYRVVHSTGEETWLGDMGGNGKVDLVMTQGDEMWKGEDWLRFDKEGWSGFGVHVDEK